MRHVEIHLSYGFFHRRGNSNSRGARRADAAPSRSVAVRDERGPLVDVVLVLLIIFMVTAQAMQSGLEIQVPQVKEVKDTVEDLPIVEITQKGTPYLNDKPVNINLLGQEITSWGRNPSTSAPIAAERWTPWCRCSTL